MKFETKLWLVTLFLIIGIEIFDEKLSFKEGFGGGGASAGGGRFCLEAEAEAKKSPEAEAT